MTQRNAPPFPFSSIKAGRLPLALGAYAAMRADGCPPNVVTFNTLIDALGKTGDADGAAAVLDEMAAARAIEPEHPLDFLPTGEIAVKIAAQTPSRCVGGQFF